MIKINNVHELIDFVNRNDISIQDAESVIEKCFTVIKIDFSEGDREPPTKAELINRIHEYSKSTDTEIKIFWQ